jgi:3-oxoacyl-[acyl-carrier-protein] synthase II
MRTRPRVVVTGIAAVSAGVGDAEEFWCYLRCGQSRLRPSCAIPGCDGMVEHMPPTGLVKQRRHERVVNRASSFLLATAAQAIRDAAWVTSDERADRVSVVVGMGDSRIDDSDILRAICRTENVQREEDPGRPADIEPLRRLKHLPNIGPALLAIEYGFGGQVMTFVSGEASGLQAVLEGFHLVTSGRADAVLCGGADALQWTSASIRELSERLSCSPVRDPAMSCRPFDLERQGTAPSEGAAVVWLESLDSAAARGARAYAEILGGAARCEPGSSEPLRIGAALCQPGDVDVLFAHGDGTHAADASEVESISEVFGCSRQRPRISSIKAVIGHARAASGPLSVVAACLAIRERVVPGIPNLQRPAAALPFVGGASAPVDAIRRMLVMASEPTGATVCVALSAQSDLT